MKKRFTLMLIAAFVAVVSFAQQGKWSGVSSRTLSTANNARTLTGKVAKHLEIKKKTFTELKQTTLSSMKLQKEK